MTSILGDSGFELQFSGTEPVTFFGHNSRLGAQFLFGGEQAVIWEAWPRNTPPPVKLGLLKIIAVHLPKAFRNCKFLVYVVKNNGRQPAVRGEFVTGPYTYQG